MRPGPAISDGYRPGYLHGWTKDRPRIADLSASTGRGSGDPPLGRPLLAYFACTLKVYSTISGRRFTCDMKDAEARDTSARPHFTTSSRPTR